MLQLEAGRQRSLLLILPVQLSFLCQPRLADFRGLHLQDDKIVPSLQVVTGGIGGRSYAGTQLQVPGASTLRPHAEAEAGRAKVTCKDDVSRLSAGM